MVKCQWGVMPVDGSEKRHHVEPKGNLAGQDRADFLADYCLSHDREPKLLSWDSSWQAVRARVRHTFDTLFLPISVRCRSWTVLFWGASFEEAIARCWPLSFRGPPTRCFLIHCVAAVTAFWWPSPKFLKLVSNKLSNDWRDNSIHILGTQFILSASQLQRKHSTITQLTWTRSVPDLNLWIRAIEEKTTFPDIKNEKHLHSESVAKSS